jgi:hypothetical protein
MDPSDPSDVIAVPRPTTSTSWGQAGLAGIQAVRRINRIAHLAGDGVTGTFEGGAPRSVDSRGRRPWNDAPQARIRLDH